MCRPSDTSTKTLVHLSFTATGSSASTDRNFSAARLTGLRLMSAMGRKLTLASLARARAMAAKKAGLAFEEDGWTAFPFGIGRDRDTPRFRYFSLF